MREKAQQQQTAAAQRTPLRCMVDPLSLMLVVIELRGVRAGWRFNLSGDLQLWRRHKPQVCRVPQLLPPLRRIDFHSDAGLRLPLRACDDATKVHATVVYICGAEHSEHTRTLALVSIRSNWFRYSFGLGCNRN